MANQVDREGLQPLIERWRNLVSTEDGNTLWDAGFEEGAHQCANELEAALQGSVASPQENLVRALNHWSAKKLEVDAAWLNFTSDQLRELNAAEGWLLSLLPIEAGSGATTPAPQPNSELAHADNPRATLNTIQKP